MKIKIIPIALILLASISCKKDKETVPTPINSFLAASDGIYINNEGGFNAGNTSITYSDGTESGTIRDVYKQVNNSDLGDICQSMTKYNDLLYLVINNSAKIEVVDLFNMKKTATITGFTSPRYILPVNAAKAYVSDLYSNHLSIVNLNTNTISGNISLSGSTEDMLLYNGKVYVTNLITPYLYIINPTTDIIEDSILIGIGGNSLRLDANNNIWILCGGDYVTSTPGSLHRINPATKLNELSLTFPASDYPNRLRINESGNTLFFLDLNVYKMPITETSLPTTAFIDAAGKSFYGLGYDKVKHLVYVSDAIDYQQAGRIYKYNTVGTELSSFPAGIIPGDFLFLNN